MRLSSRTYYRYTGRLKDNVSPSNPKSDKRTKYQDEVVFVMVVKGSNK